MLSISYYYFEFQVGFYFLVRRGNLISLSLLNFRAFANVVRSQIYFVTFLVQYYSQKATIIVFGTGFFTPALSDWNVSKMLYYLLTKL